MAGIAGIVNLQENLSKYTNVINNMCNKLSHRGNNSQGYCIKESSLFGYKGSISTFSQLESYTCLFDGVIYNSKDIIKELSKLGHIVNSNSDAELILTSYSVWKYDMLKKLNGVFAFSIWDDDNKELFIARDHFGIKPVFYSFISNNFIFASEIKGVLEHPLVSRKIDAVGISELFGLRSCTFFWQCCI